MVKFALRYLIREILPRTNTNQHEQEEGGFCPQAYLVVNTRRQQTITPSSPFVLVRVVRGLLFFLSRRFSN
jgi:hypothetical protein